MTIVYRLLAIGALIVSAVGLLLAFRPNFSAIPWLGLAIVVLGTGVTFNVSAHLVTGGHDGVGIGPIITSMVGLGGLGIFSASVRLRAIPFVPLGAIVAGGIYISSFYAYMPPFNPDFPGQFVFAAPGIVLVAYGAFLWYRSGLAESMEHRSLILRVAFGLVTVAGLAVLGLLMFERPGPHKLLAELPDFGSIAGESPLVVEGLVVNEEAFKYRYRMHGSTIRTRGVRFTLYEIDVSEYWRGSGNRTVHIAVPRDQPVKSPVKMKVGQSYLIFSSGIEYRERLPRHWALEYPTRVWIPRDGKFYPYPGLPREAPITRDFVAKLLESKPYSGN